MVTGSEETFNDLLCTERNRNTGKQEARTYRLNRIDGLNYGRSMKNFRNEEGARVTKAAKEILSKG